jgi:dethiobiotin synthase
MSAFFVTSTGTDIGKTYVGCGLINHWRAKGRKVGAFKPLLSGFDSAKVAESDAGRLLAALGRPLNDQSLDEISPWRYTAAISADAAAAKEGKQVEYPAVLSASRAFLDGGHDVALIEGAGGVMAPLSDDRTMLAKHRCQEPAASFASTCDQNNLVSERAHQIPGRFVIRRLPRRAGPDRDFHTRSTGIPDKGRGRA